MYLLSDSPEAQEMRNKITMMLEGGDMGQVMLVFQLLEGGGIHPEHLTHLLFFQHWYPHFSSDTQDIGAQAGKLFQNSAPQEAKKRVKRARLPVEIPLAAKERDRVKECEFTYFLETRNQENTFHAATFAALVLFHYGMGAHYLLIHNARPVSWILRQLYKFDNSLNFSNFRLETLPEGIEHCGDIDTLDISGNPLRTLPKGIGKARIEHILFDLPPLHEDALAQLMQYFPDATANRLFDMACDEKTRVGKCRYPAPNPHHGYVRARGFFEKAVECRPDYAEIWHNIGACWVFYGAPEKGKEALEKAIEWYKARLDGYIAQGQVYTTDASYNHFWISCAYALLQDREEAFYHLRATQSPYYLRSALTEEDWGAYRHDPEFRAIVEAGAR